MSLQSLFVVAGLILLGLWVITRFAIGVRLRSAASISCIVLGVGLIALGLGFRNWHLEKATGAITQLGSRGNQRPVAAAQKEESTWVAPKRAVVSLSFFAGNWKNMDSESRGLSTLHVRTGGDSVWIHAWEKCRPTDCDWGEVPGSTLASTTSSDPKSQTQKVTALFQTSFSDTVMTLTPADEDSLEVDTQTKFTDNSSRSSYSSTYTFRH
jgi:hypothetical protein